VGRGDVALALALAVVAAGVVVPAAPARAHGVPWTVVASGSRVGSAEADAASILRTRTAVRAFSSLLRLEEARRVAAVDLARSAVVAVVAPFPSCGWSVRVRALERSGTRLRVLFTAQPPAKGTLVCEALTRAYVVLRVLRSQVAGVVRAVPIRA